MPFRSADAPHAGFDRLVVTPAQARKLLGVGNTYLYQLIKEGAIDSYNEGRGRRITVSSILAHIQRKLEAAGKRAA
jgi:excisionase family DNA binding protein